MGHTNTSRHCGAHGAASHYFCWKRSVITSGHSTAFPRVKRRGSCICALGCKALQVWAPGGSEAQLPRLPSLPAAEPPLAMLFISISSLQPLLGLPGLLDVALEALSLTCDALLKQCHTNASLAHHCCQHHTQNSPQVCISRFIWKEVLFGHLWSQQQNSCPTSLLNPQMEKREI